MRGRDSPTTVGFMEDQVLSTVEEVGVQAEVHEAIENTIAGGGEDESAALGPGGQDISEGDTLAISTAGEGVGAGTITDVIGNTIASVGEDEGGVFGPGGHEFTEGDTLVIPTAGEGCGDERITDVIENTIAVGGEDDGGLLGPGGQEAAQGDTPVISTADVGGGEGTITGQEQEAGVVEIIMEEHGATGGTLQQPITSSGYGHATLPNIIPISYHLM